MTTAVIVDAVRTPGGKRNGKLRNWHAVDLASESLKALAERNGLDPALVDDVIMGCVMQVSEQSLNVGRNAVLAAGWPESVPATTIDRQCGSSQQAIHFAAQGVIAGAYDVVVAAGVESMTHTPMGSSVVRDFGFPFGPRMMARYSDDEGHSRLKGQGIGAEMIADQWGISREELDAFSVRSHQRAARATAEGRFEREIVPVAGPRRRGQRHRRGLRGRRGHPARLDRRGAGQPEAGLQGGRQGHGGELVADHRRLVGRADHERGEGELAGPDAAGALLRLRPGRRRPGDHADGSDPRHHHGARAGQAHAGRHRRGGDQRGVRVGRAGLGEGAPPEHGRRQRQRRRHRARATRWAPRAGSSWPRW